MPSCAAFRATLAWMPVPGKTMTPIGMTASIASLRLRRHFSGCCLKYLKSGGG
jgi:hypothetical protein